MNGPTFGGAGKPTFASGPLGKQAPKENVTFEYYKTGIAVAKIPHGTARSKEMREFLKSLFMGNPAVQVWKYSDANGWTNITDTAGPVLSGNPFKVIQYTGVQMKNECPAVAMIYIRNGDTGEIVSLEHLQSVQFDPLPQGGRYASETNSTHTMAMQDAFAQQFPPAFDNGFGSPFPMQPSVGGQAISSQGFGSPPAQAFQSQNGPTCGSGNPAISLQGSSSHGQANMLLGPQGGTTTVQNQPLGSGFGSTFPMMAGGVGYGQGDVTKDPSYAKEIAAHDSSSKATWSCAFCAQSVHDLDKTSKDFLHVLECKLDCFAKSIEKAEALMAMHERMLQTAMHEQANRAIVGSSSNGLSAATAVNVDVAEPVTEQKGKRGGAESRSRASKSQKKGETDVSAPPPDEEA